LIPWAAARRLGTVSGRLLGHSTIAVTMNTYSHVLASRDVVARAKSLLPRARAVTG